MEINSKKAEVVTAFLLLTAAISIFFYKNVENNFFVLSFYFDNLFADIWKSIKKHRDRVRCFFILLKVVKYNNCKIFFIQNVNLILQLSHY